MSETQLVSAILEALELEPGVVAWRNNTGRKGRVSFGLGKGSADIICAVAPWGRFVALEAKDEKGKQSDEQQRWGNAVWLHGGVYAICRSVLDARSAIDYARGQKGTADGTLSRSSEVKSRSVTRRR